MLRTATLFLICLTVSAYWVSERDLVAGVHGFNRLPLALQTYDLFDVGVVDFEGDALLDIFTVNHSARQSFMRNLGGGRFEERYGTLGLAQSRGYSHSEDQAQPPKMATAGFYVYRRERWLFLQAHNVDPSQPITGRMSLAWDIEIDESRSEMAAVLELDQASEDNGSDRTQMRFELRESQQIVLRGVNDIVEVPHQLELSDDVDLERVFIGQRAQSPAAHSFVLNWRDRHAFAWADVDGDSSIDAYVARGGVKGRIADVPASLNDELFMAAGAEFRDALLEYEFEKLGCPARQANWVDANTDGRIDLHIVCNSVGTLGFPDQLWLRTGPQSFRNIAHSAGLANPKESFGAWRDFDGDGDADYIAAQFDGVSLYRNDAALFVKEPLTQSLRSSIKKLGVADFDADGDLDVYGVGRRDAVLLINENGTFSPVSASAFGLPEDGLTVNWVDYDNDGKLDVHVVPHGIYAQQADGQFARTRLLYVRTAPSLVRDAMCSWFDADQNGTRDALCAYQVQASLPSRLLRKHVLKQARTIKWQAFLHLNEHGRDNDWLQVQLIGATPNRQSIGATVRVSTESGTQTAHPGHAEGAHYSQGHYRVYFGLGTTNDVREVNVTWADAETSSVHDVSPNQSLVIRHPSYAL